MGRDWEPDARYCAESGKWIFWLGDRWETDRTKRHLTRTRKWMREREAAIISARPSQAKRAAELRDDRKIYAVDKLVTTNAELVCTSDQWDTDPMLLGGPRTIDAASITRRSRSLTLACARAGRGYKRDPSYASCSVACRGARTLPRSRLDVHPARHAAPSPAAHVPGCAGARQIA
jgi:hypothetical protein